MIHVLYVYTLHVHVLINVHVRQTSVGRSAEHGARSARAAGGPGHDADTGWAAAAAAAAGGVLVLVRRRRLRRRRRLALASTFDVQRRVADDASLHERVVLGRRRRRRQEGGHAARARSRRPAAECPRSREHVLSRAALGRVVRRVQRAEPSRGVLRLGDAKRAVVEARAGRDAVGARRRDRAAVRPRGG